MAGALDLTAAPEAPDRAAVAQRLVRERFSIQTMASALAGIYAGIYPDLYADPDPSPEAQSPTVAP